MRKIKETLEEGYKMTKYSKDGFNPHDKTVFLSSDGRKLCWKEKGDSAYKSIELDSIIAVEYGKYGEGIRKHVKSPVPKQYCMIEYSTADKNKFI